MASKKTKSAPKEKVVDKDVEIEVRTRMSLIRTLVEMYYDFQKQRIMTNNRISMNCERNGITDAELGMFGVKSIQADAEKFEKDLKKLITQSIKDVPIYRDYLKKITGIGEILAAGLVAYIDDVSKFDNISKLWQYAGYGMNRYCETCKAPTFEVRKYEKKTAKKMKPMEKCNECGEHTVPIIQQRRVGYMSNWNDNLKKITWLATQSFLKQSADSAGYRGIYDNVKPKEREKHPEKQVVNKKTFYNDGHIHNRSLRKVGKVFLANLWLQWREMEGLPVSEPYLIHKNPAHNMIQPFTDKS